MEQRLPVLPLLLLAIMPVGQPAFAAEQFKSETEASQHCPAGSVAWLNTASGKIHRKDSPWYGRTRAGAYICQSAQLPKAGTRRWTPLAAINAFDGGATLYAALSSIQRHESNAEMDVLMDFKHAQEAAGIKFLSSELHKEYNCKNGQWRILSSTVFDQNMGEGRTVQSDKEPDDWKQADPESIAKTEWNKACARKKSPH